MTQRSVEAAARLKSLAAKLFEVYSQPEHHRSSSLRDLRDGQGSVWHTLNRSAYAIGKEIPGQTEAMVKKAIRSLCEEGKLCIIGEGSSATYFVRTAPQNDS